MLTSTAYHDQVNIFVPRSGPKFAHECSRATRTKQTHTLGRNIYLPTTLTSSHAEDTRVELDNPPTLRENSSSARASSHSRLWLATSPVTSRCSNPSALCLPYLSLLLFRESTVSLLPLSVLLQQYGTHRYVEVVTLRVVLDVLRQQLKEFGGKFLSLVRFDVLIGHCP